MKLGKLKLFDLGLLVVSALCVYAIPAQAESVLPSGGNFVSGTGTISSNGTNLTVNQSTNRGIINWDSFSIGQGNAATFNNGTGATLNRVTGDSLSEIMGSLKATGSLYLINKNGVVIGPTGLVTAGGSFIASTRDIDDVLFMNGGTPTFVGNGNGDIVNAGSIVSDHGDVVLVGRSVTNEGTIDAPEGAAQLLAGDTIVLQAADQPVSHTYVVGGKGDVSNKGAIKAAQAKLASAGGNVYALAINNDSNISATGTVTKNGEVWLVAGQDAVVSGKISAKNHDGSGGKIIITGKNITLQKSSQLNAKATNKGGTIFVGGTGSKLSTDDVVPTAETVTVEAGAELAADATETGAGGNIVVWADGALQAAGGLFSATGPDKGGFIETSGGTVDFDGISVNTKSAHGSLGEWLIDPYDLTVDASAASTIGTNLGSSNVTLQTNASSSSGPGTVNTSGTGKITVSNAITASGGGSLTLSAYQNVVISAAITLQGGTLTLGANNTGGSSGNITISGVALTTNNGNIVLGGGVTPLTGYAYNTAGTGISIASGSSLNSGSGYISIRGRGAGSTANIIGVNLAGALTATSGNITIYGQTDSTSTASRGFIFFNSGASISTDSGNVSIYGITTQNINDARAVMLYNTTTGGNSITTNSGNILLDATAAFSPTVINFSSARSIATNAAISSTSGNITFAMDNASWAGVAGSTQYSTTSGTITFAPKTTNSTIGVGSGSNTFQLTDTILGFFSAAKYVFGSSTAGNLTINSAKDFGTANVSFLSGGNISLDANLNKTSGSGAVNYIFQSAGSIANSSSATITASAGSINLSLDSNTDNSGNEAISLGGATIATNGGTLSINDPLILTGAMVFNSGAGSQSYTGTINGAFGLTINAGSASFGGTIGGTTAVGSFSVTTTNSLTLPSVSATSLVASSTNDIVLQNGAILTASGAGNALTLNAGAAFTNNAGSSALNLSGGGRWLIYSANPANNNFGNLNSTNTAVWNTTYASTPPASIVQTGNRYIFALQPTFTVASTSASKTYGDTIDISSNYSISGLQTGVSGAFAADTLSSFLSGTPTLSSSGTAITTGTGSYAITVSNGTLAVNTYALVLSSSGNLTIAARPITITADAQSKTYGDANPALTYSLTSGSLVNSDTLSGSLTTAVTALTGVGSYGITQGSLTAGGNYTLTYAPALLTVAARPITITAAAQSKTYGDANPALTYSLTSGSLVNSDTLSGSLTTTAGQFSPVASYSITQGSLTAGGNYTLTYAPAMLTVAARPITITADAQSKTYGDANPALTYSLTSGSLVNSDTLSGSLTTTAGQFSPVASYSITQGSLTAGGNYTLTYAPALLTVAARPITITAAAQSKTYGDANPALTYSLTSGSLVNSDTLSGSLTTTAGQFSPVASYSITQGSLTAGGNYSLTYAPAMLTIAARPITITAAAQSKTYGDVNPTLTYSLTSGSLVNSDTLSGSLTTAVTALTGVGSYGITQGSLTAGGNYTLTYAPALLTVAARPITVVALNASKDVGAADPTLTYNASGLVNGDAITSALNGALARLTGESVGTYSILQGTLVAYGNYSLASFTPGIFTINDATTPVVIPPVVPTPVVTPPVVTIADLPAEQTRIIIDQTRILLNNLDVNTSVSSSTNLSFGNIGGFTPASFVVSNFSPTFSVEPAIYVERSAINQKVFNAIPTEEVVNKDEYQLVPLEKYIEEKH